MPTVESWFWDWLVAHQDRHPLDPSGWPAIDDAPEFYDGLKSLFVTRGIFDRDVADEASVSLMGDPRMAFRQHHPAALVAACSEINRLRAAAGIARPADSREAAAMASRDCDDCRGDGLTLRVRRLSRGTADAQGRRRPDAIVLYCRCPLGRWIEREHRTKHPEIRKRLHDLEEHPWLWGDEYRRPPSLSDLASPEPMPAF